MSVTLEISVIFNRMEMQVYSLDSLKEIKIQVFRQIPILTLRGGCASSKRPKGENEKFQSENFYIFKQKNEKRASPTPLNVDTRFLNLFEFLRFELPKKIWAKILKVKKIFCQKKSIFSKNDPLPKVFGFWSYSTKCKVFDKLINEYTCVFKK